MAKRDYYEVLGVARGADEDEIKKAYRRLAMKHHPDRNPDDDGAEAKFKEVREAYACLSDEEKRAAYDRYGHKAFENGGPGAGGGESEGFSSFFDDIFSNFFEGGGRREGGGGRRGGRRQRVLDIRLSFAEMAAGCEKEVRLTLPVKCGGCGGSGAKEGARPTTCRACGGAGQVRVQRGVFTLQQTCSKCRGAGRVIENPCERCGGAGVEKKTRHLQVAIPAGIEDGALVRVNIEGGVDELFIRTHVGSHPLFERQGNDLHIEATVGMVTAALGGEVMTPSVRGGRIEVVIPAGVQHGQVLRVPGHGLPGVRGGRGNLLCHIRVEVPVRLNSEQKELLKKFRESLAGGRSSPQEQSWLDKIRKFF